LDRAPTPATVPTRCLTSGAPSSRAPGERRSTRSWRWCPPGQSDRTTQKENNMAKSQTGDKPKRERRPARSIEERIAELQARAEAKHQRARAKAAAELATLNERVGKLE